MTANVHSAITTPRKKSIDFLYRIVELWFSSLLNCATAEIWHFQAKFTSLFLSRPE